MLVPALCVSLLTLPTQAIPTLVGQLSFSPVFGWWAAVPLACIMLISLWLTLTSPGISWGGRFTLMLLRLGATLVLLLAMLRPGLIQSTERAVDGAIAVLMDRSQSATLPSETSGLSRWDVQRAVWNDIASSTQLELEGLRLIPYFYDRQAAQAAGEDLPNLDKSFEQEPAGRLTDLGRALADAAKLQLDPPLRGVIMMGDATQTLIPAELEPTAVASQMAQLDQPIAFIGVGQRGDQGMVKDVALEGMPENMSAFVAKELSVPIVVKSQGMQSVPMKVQLTLRASGKPDRVVGSREILASSPSERLPVEFRVAVQDAGEYLLVAQVEVDTREQITTNNTLHSFITVREGGVRILYLEGQPRAEQTFLKRSLEQSLDFDVKYFWYPESAQRGRPREIDIKLDQFDAFILGDLDSSALTPKTVEGLVTRVRQGAGLLLMGGYHAFDAGGYGRSGLAQLIPFEMQRPTQQWDAPINETLHVLQDITLTPTRPHPITNLGAEPESSRAWRGLVPLKGMNRIGPLKQGPGIQTLLASATGEPALVTGEAGNGRVLAFAGDTTYQWYLAGEKSGQKRAHQQFWRQALLWLIRRDSISEGFRLTMDRRRLEIDATPRVGIQWFGGSDNRVMPSDIKLELSREGAWLRNLESTNVDPATSEVRPTGLDQPGLYRIALTANAEDGKSYATDIAFMVVDESRELSQLTADWQMMQNIVAANSAAGGRLYLPEEIDEALDWFRERQDSAKVTLVERRQLGDAAWDAWLTLVLFCILLSIEWGLRKSWQLP